MYLQLFPVQVILKDEAAIQVKDPNSTLSGVIPHMQPDTASGTNGIGAEHPGWVLIFTDIRDHQAINPGIRANEQFIPTGLRTEGDLPDILIREPFIKISQDTGVIAGFIVGDTPIFLVRIIPAHKYVFPQFICKNIT